MNPVLVRLWCLLLACMFSLGPGARAEEAPRTTVSDITFDVGVGYDSNAFLAPDAPYIDQNSLTTVDPVRESGFFLPVRIDGEIDVPLGGRRGFVTAWRARGSFYPEAATSNAEETYAKIAPGFRFDLGDQERRERSLRLTPFASYNKEIFFDRDTGLGGQVGGVDASNRYSYTAVGAELELDYEAFDRLELFAKGVAETRGYARASGVESFDHDRYRVDAGVVLRLARRARLEVEYGYQQRSYDEREAKDLDGQSTSANPQLEYTYRELETALRLRPVRAWNLELIWSRTERGDEYVGYNDYTQTGYRVRSTLRGRRGRLRISARHWEREFDTAFIFDEPINLADGSPNPRKSYDTTELGFLGEINWRKHARFYTEIRVEDQQTADPRFSYARTQVMTGMRWVY